MKCSAVVAVAAVGVVDVVDIDVVVVAAAVVFSVTLVLLELKLEAQCLIKHLDYFKGMFELTGGICIMDF